MYIQNQISYDCMICFSAFLLAASQEDMIFSTACGGVFIVVCSFLILVNNNENCPLQGDESIKKLYGTRKRGWSFGKRYHNDA